MLDAGSHGHASSRFATMTHFSSGPAAAEPPAQTSRPSVVPVHKRREVVVVFVVCALAAAVLAAAFWPQAKVVFALVWQWVIAARDWVRDAGPGWFFAAFTVLPACGVPLSLFTLTVAPAFSTQIGLGWVIVLSAASLALNLALSYWLARHALRPLVEKIVLLLGYKLPAAAPGEHVLLCILLRFVPGPPYAVQSYILGLAKVRFRPYMAVSFLGQFGWTLAAIFFGDALARGGSGKTFFIALALIAALVIATRIVRGRLSRNTGLTAAQKEPGADGARRV